MTGDPTRRQGPFPGDVPRPERSGLFLYLNTSKRGVTLNLEDPQGRAMLGELAANADVLIHDRQPPARDNEGLDTDALADANPDLIVASVTPFGNWGPYAGYRAHDVNVFHAGGEGWLLPNGLALDTFPDRAPIAAGSQMGSYQGGLTAALGVAAAVYTRANGSPGQSVDCSMQEAQLSLGYVPIQRLEEEGIVEDRFARLLPYRRRAPCPRRLRGNADPGTGTVAGPRPDARRSRMGHDGKFPEPRRAAGRDQRSSEGVVFRPHQGMALP